MKAIMPYKSKDQDGKLTEEMLLFDTETATELCDILNDFKKPIRKLYLSHGGILFSEKLNGQGGLKVEDQKWAKEYIGENCPEIYEKVFGKVKEA